MDDSSLDPIEPIELIEPIEPIELIEPTVIEGYPEIAASHPAEAAAPKALDGLPGQVRTVRTLLLACLALLLLLTAGMGAALAGALSQVGELSAQVTALNGRLDAALAAPAADPAPADQGAAAQAAGVEQLGEATALEGVSALPTGADAAGAILIGDPNATNVVEVYVDHQCPYCQKWEQEIGSTLFAKAVQPGSDLLVKQYNLAFLGEASADLTPAGASARAANATACVLHSDGPESFVKYSSAVFAVADPSEPPGQFPKEQLVSLATDAGVSAEAVACIKDERYVPFVAATTKAGFARGVGGTPTVIVNGQTLGNPFTDPALEALVAS